MFIRNVTVLFRRSLHQVNRSNIHTRELARFARNAVVLNDINAVKNAILKGLDVNHDDGFSPPLIHLAFSREILEALFAAGGDIDASDPDGNTILHTTRRPEIAKWLLKHGAKIEALNDLGRPPLLHQRDVRIVRILLKEGANPNACDKRGFPLLALSDYRSVQIIRALLEAKVDPNCRIKIDNSTPLFHAHKLCNVKLLLKYGANPDLTDVNGMTSAYMLDYSKKESVSILRLLIKSGLDLNHKDKRGNTLLQHLLQGKYSDNQAAIKVIQNAIKKKKRKLNNTANQKTIEAVNNAAENMNKQSQNTSTLFQPKQKIFYRDIEDEVKRLRK